MKKVPNRNLRTRIGHGDEPVEIQLPDLSRFWNTFPQLPGDSDRFIEEDRDRGTETTRSTRQTDS